MNVSIQLDMSDTQNLLANAQQQIPYATAQAINNTMKGAQTAIGNDIKNSMIIRNAAFLKYSLKITQFARKTNLEGVLSIADLPGKQSADLLSKFDTTSNITRKEPKQAHELAIPTAQVQPHKQSIIPSSKRPRNLDAIKIKAKSGVDILVAKNGRSKRAPLQVLYILSKRGVPISHRFSFFTIGQRYVMEHFQDEFDKAFVQAMATAK